MKHLSIILSFVFISNLAFSQDFQKLYSLGNDYAQKGNYKKAIVHFRKAEKSAGKKYEKNRVYQALAENYSAISEYANAIDYYEKLYKIYNSENRKTILLNLSDLWIITGQYSKVIDSLKNMQNCPDEIVRLTNLSAAYSKKHQYTNAIALLDSALKTKDSPNYKIALQNKGYIYWRQRKNKEAEKLLEEAVILFDARDGGKYLCMANLALVKSENGKYDDALKYINSVLEWQLLHLGKRNQDYIISLRKKAEILMNAGKTADATTFFKEFFYAEKEYVIRNFMYMTEQERLNFWHTVKFQIDKCYQIENQDAAFLFDVALFQKNVLTLTNINFYQIASNHDKYDILLELRAKSLIAETEEEREYIERQSEEIEKELVGSFIQLKNFRKLLEISSIDINKVLKPNDVAIEFVYYRRQDTMRYGAVVLQKDKGVNFVPMFTKDEIEQYKIGFGTLSSCMNTIATKDGPTLQQNFNLIYNDSLLKSFIWNKELNTVINSNVYFVPDGIFYKIGIEYLCPKEDVKLYRLSSMRVLLESRPKPNYDSVLLIGDIDYDDISLAKMDSIYIPDRVGSLFFSSNFDTLGRSTKNELKYAKNNLKVKLKDMLLKNEATEEVVKKVLPNYNLVLFSTHGYSKSATEFNDDDYPANITSCDYSMAKCGIALSGANILSQRDSAYQYYEDGLLTAIEFGRLDLQNMDLAIFSACETQLGTISNNGSFNLPRGLKKAGANSVVATLCKVEKNITGKLMSEFIRQLRLGKTKIEALTAAQKYIQDIKTWDKNDDGTYSYDKHYDDKPYNSPYYWAPFILIDGLN